MGRLTGGDPSLLRRINSAVVLHALRGAGAPTLTDLTRITGLSRPTVEGVVEGLFEAGLVVEAVPDESEARRQGRPARRFRFRAEAGHLLGVEIGPHRVSALISGLDGRIIGAGSRVVSETAGADDRLDQVRAVIADVLRRTGVARSSLRAVGVGSPGIVEADGTVRLGTALPDWTGLPLGERLRRSFRCPVLVENDANAAAVAEHWKGAATESDDVVFVLAGLSPGAGSLIGGRLHRGFGGAAGEIGALHLLGRELTPEHLLSTTDTPLDPLDEQAVAVVFAKAKEGDAGAAGGGRAVPSAAGARCGGAGAGARPGAGRGRRLGRRTGRGAGATAQGAGPLLSAPAPGDTVAARRGRRRDGGAAAGAGPRRRGTVRRRGSRDGPPLTVRRTPSGTTRARRPHPRTGVVGERGGRGAERGRGRQEAWRSGCSSWLISSAPESPKVSRQVSAR